MSGLDDQQEREYENASLCVAILVLPAAYASLTAVTVAEMKGVAEGAYPQQYELEFEAAANCTMSFSANPDIAALNSKIKGNSDLPALADRIPAEPLVVVPYDSVGKYGGTLDVLSNATEAGTSDFLSVRHVNLVRFSDDLQTIVPNVAKSWEWNADFTKLTFHLRKVQMVDGAPFTSADVKFYHDNLMLVTNIFEKLKDYITVGGDHDVDTPDETTVVFNLPSPKPGLLHTSRPPTPRASSRSISSVSSIRLLTRMPTSTRSRLGSRMVMTPLPPITATRTGPTRRRRF